MNVISVQDLTKRYGRITAVDSLSFDVEPGTVTGFVGPNGAGKSTTLRTTLGLVHPTSGRVLVNGVAYAELTHPARQVGAFLDTATFHPGRRARDHLRVLATAAGVPEARVDEVLDEVGLTAAARRRVGGFSMGMRQRLGLAGALLGRPELLILDEPANGLDPEGVRWLRGLLRDHAGAGGTVLLSSHLLAELALSADRIVIVKGGRLVAAGRVADLTGTAAQRVRVRSPQLPRLREVLHARGLRTSDAGESELIVAGALPEDVGRAVAEAGVVVYEMRREDVDLEDAVLSLTRDRS